MQQDRRSQIEPKARHVLRRRFGSCPAFVSFGSDPWLSLLSGLSLSVVIADELAARSSPCPLILGNAVSVTLVVRLGSMEARRPKLHRCNFRQDAVTDTPIGDRVANWQLQAFGRSR